MYVNGWKGYFSNEFVAILRIHCLDVFYKLKVFETIMDFISLNETTVFIQNRGRPPIEAYFNTSRIFKASPSGLNDPIFKNFS